MALTIINFSDPVTSLVTKTNTISQNLGDIEELTVADDNTVDAINRLKSEIDAIDTTILDFRDSAEIVDIARHSIRVVDAGGLGSLTYGAGGTITYTGPDQGDIRDLISLDDDADSVMSYDVANGRLGLKTLPNHKIRDGAIKSIKFNSKVTLEIYDASGTVIKTLYSPGV